mgnify:CR=1 FL=1
MTRIPQQKISWQFTVREATFLFFSFSFGHHVLLVCPPRTLIACLFGLGFILFWRTMGVFFLSLPFYPLKRNPPYDFKIGSILEENKFTKVFIWCSRKFLKILVSLRPLKRFLLKSTESFKKSNFLFLVLETWILGRFYFKMIL